MEKKKKSIDPKKDNQIDIYLPDINSVVSSTECTGLTPSAIMNEDEAESYTDIYKIHMANLARDDWKKNNEKTKK